MHDEDALHPNSSLQQKLQHIYELRRESSGRVNFEDNSHYQILLEALGNPHKQLPPVIHVAGTNGKGSVIATLRAILEAEGYKVHAYTSPHLLTFNERIYLAGENVADEVLEATLDELFEKNGDNPVTFFEFTSALAFLLFQRHEADVVLLETGMGGRLDCSNVIEKPLATVITPISFDHMEFLGDTITKIAAEKAGIIKQDVPCISGPQSDDACKVLRDKSDVLDAAFINFENDWNVEKSKEGFTFQFKNNILEHYPLPNLLGDHQIYNSGTALAVIETIHDQLPVTEDAKREGLQNIYWPGRMERKEGSKYNVLLPKDWELWFDCGHNVDGAKTVAVILDNWKKQGENKPVHILLGMKDNKDVKGVCAILEPYCESLTLFPVATDCSRQIKEVVREAPFAPAKILICGSLYNYF